MEDDNSCLDFNEIKKSKKKNIKNDEHIHDLDFSIRTREFKKIIQCIADNFNDLDKVTHDVILSYFIGVNDNGIVNLSEDDIKTVINEHLKVDKSLLESWNDIDEDNFEKKYLIAIQNKFTTILANAIKENFKIDEQFKKAFTIEINNFLMNFSNAIQPLLSQLNDAMVKLIKSIDIPDIDDVQKEKLEASYRRWGEYGWTLLPNSPIDFFNNVPSTQIEADKLALVYCTNDYILNLFEMFRKNVQISQDDLEESIYTFNHEKYKSCVMIIFSMLDSILIKLQRDEDRAGVKKYRPSGKKAVSNINNRIQNQDSEYKMGLFLWVNVISCLKKVFEEGNDFKIQQEVININFLDNGILERKVKRNDCIQVFILLHNMCELFSLFDLLDKEV